MVADVQKVGFFQEAPGVNSSMRLMCFLALLAAISSGGWTIWNDPQAAGGVGMHLTYAFLLAAFAPKLAQKIAEEKLGITIQEPPPPTAVITAAAVTVKPQG
jgi:hypothetical protein